MQREFKHPQIFSDVLTLTQMYYPLHQNLPKPFRFAVGECILAELAQALRLSNFRRGGDFFLLHRTPHVRPIMTTEPISLSLDDVLDTSGQRARHLYDRTLAQLKDSDLAAAAQSFQELGLLRRGDVALLPLHAAVALALNKADEAAWVLGQALKLNPQDASLWFNLGQALLMAKNWLRAVQAFDRLALLQPANAEVYYHRSLALRALGQGARADTDVQEALRLHPEHQGALEEQKRAYVLARDSRRAERAAVPKLVVSGPG